MIARRRSSAGHAGASIGRTIAGRRTPQVIGPDSDSCLSTSTGRRTFAPANNASTVARASRHGSAVRRIDRTCCRPITIGSRNTTAPATQPPIRNAVSDGNSRRDDAAGEPARVVAAVLDAAASRSIVESSSAIA